MINNYWKLFSLLEKGNDRGIILAKEDIWCSYAVGHSNVLSTHSEVKSSENAYIWKRLADLSLQNVEFLLFELSHWNKNIFHAS